MILGLVFLLGDLPLFWLAAGSGVVLLAVGLACVSGLLPAIPWSGWALVGLAGLAFSLLVVGAWVATDMVRVATGGAMAVFGIVKLT